MASPRVMYVSDLISEGIVPESMRNDDVLWALCKQTHLSVEARKALIVMYVLIVQGNE